MIHKHLVSSFSIKGQIQNIVLCMFNTNFFCVKFLTETEFVRITARATKNNFENLCFIIFYKRNLNKIYLTEMIVSLLLCVDSARIIQYL